MLRRARDLVEVVIVSDKLALAAARLRLGHQLDVVREQLGLDENAVVNLRQRVRVEAKRPRPSGSRKPGDGRPRRLGLR